MVLAILCVLAAVLLVIGGVCMVSDAMRGCMFSTFWMLSGGVEALAGVVGQLLSCAAAALSDSD